MAWPHQDTDWRDMLDDVRQCYREIIKAITDGGDNVLLVSREPVEAGSPRIKIAIIPTNDTWTRDYGPIRVETDGTIRLLNFTFNAWGMKFAANYDNQVTGRLDAMGLLPHPVENRLDLVLEGGSIESDGHGTLMTTSRCLLSPNRNDALSAREIEDQLKQRLGVRRVLWLHHGSIAGDDTDGHIDTLARFAPGNVIVYSPCSTEAETSLMEAELRTFTTAEGSPYRLVRLPQPPLVLDDDGQPMPATYANFLCTNTRVLVPTYGADTDRTAIATIASCFPQHEAIGINCVALIKQHGSLHCATMNI